MQLTYCSSCKQMTNHECCKCQEEEVLKCFDKAYNAAIEECASLVQLRGIDFGTAAETDGKDEPEFTKNLVAWDVCGNLEKAIRKLKKEDK